MSYYSTELRGGRGVSKRHTLGTKHRNHNISPGRFWREKCFVLVLSIPLLLTTIRYLTSFLERKGKEVDLYSAYRQYNSTTKRSDVDTQSYLQIHHICLSFVYAFARGRTAAKSFTHLSTVILLIPCPTEGGRLGWPGWLTHSGRLTHEVVTRQP